MKCPDCENENIISEGDGIMSCEACNLIFDSGPQWMKYKPAESAKEKAKVIEVKNRSNAVLKWQTEVRTNISIGKKYTFGLRRNKSNWRNVKARK